MILELLSQSGAVKSGHFLLSSGLHSDRYCQCAALFEHPRLAAQAAEEMAGRVRALGADVVLAPALGGVLWGYELARALGVRSFFAERGVSGAFEIRRSFVLESGMKVLLAEDVVTTGGSVMELVPLIEAAGASIAGFAAVADRSRGRFQPPQPFQALAALDFDTWKPEECPLCAAGSKAVKPGSRPVPARAHQASA